MIQVILKPVVLSILMCIRNIQKYLIDWLLSKVYFIIYLQPFCVLILSNFPEYTRELKFTRILYILVLDYSYTSIVF